MGKKSALHRLCEKHGADKANPNGYCNFYEDHLSRFRESRDVRLLELGVLKGASLRVWRDWINGEVHGADITLTKPIERVSQHTLNLEVIDDVMQFSSKIGFFDVIIDDAGHTMEQQQNAFNILWDNVKPGRAYVIEDLGTSLLPDKINKYTKIAYNVWREPTTLTMVESLQSKVPFVSKWITLERYERILGEIESVHLFKKSLDQDTPAITSVIWKRY